MTPSEALAYLNDRARRTPVYIARARDVYYSMSLHVDGAGPAYADLRTGQEVKPYNYFGTEYQRIFDQKLFSKYPRENEVTRQYRKSQYRPFTKDPFQAAINFTVGAMFQDSGYNIEVSRAEDNAYIWDSSFEGDDISRYIQKRFKSICVDPNAFFVVIPKEAASETTTQKIEPEIWFIPSKSVVMFAPDTLIFERGNTTWLVNSTAYYRFVKDGEGNYYALDEDWYYGHGLGFMPAFIAGGVWNTQGFYESWLTGGLAWADEFVAAKSTAQLVDKENSHPYIIEPSIDCGDCQGIGQIELCGGCHHGANACRCAGDIGDTYSAKCTACNGAGFIQRDPAQHLIVPPKELAENSDLIKIVNPDVSINKYHQDNNNNLYKQLFESIYLRYIDQAQSGVAKEMDLEGRLNFYTAVSNDLFDRLIPGMLDSIIGLRNVRVVNGIIVPDFGDYEIQKPVTFLLQSAAQLLSEYEAATRAGLPTFVTSALLQRYVEKQFTNDSILKKKAKVINILDDFATKNDDQIQRIGMSGFVPIEAIRMHYLLPKLIDELLLTQGEQWFVSSDISTIRQALKFDSRLADLATQMIPNYEFTAG